VVHSSGWCDCTRSLLVEVELGLEMPARQSVHQTADTQQIRHGAQSLRSGLRWRYFVGAMRGVRPVGGNQGSRLVRKDQREEAPPSTLGSREDSQNPAFHRMVPPNDAHHRGRRVEVGSVSWGLSIASRKTG